VIAAVYARKSTVENVSDDAKSTTRQIELASRFATAHGWTVDERFIFRDDAVSGANFVNRDGLNRLLDAAGLDRQSLLPRRGARPKFDVLVTMAVDRLGREQFAVSMILARLVETGIRVYFYDHGRELRLDTPIDKLMLSIEGFGAEHYRDQVRRKTREGLRNLAQKGLVAGGKVLGYRNVGDHKARRREVDPEQAELVRRIFEMSAAGTGLLRIAKTLNLESVKNPTGQDRKQSSKRSEYWSPTGIRDVLRNKLYLGHVQYGRTKWVDRGGRRVKVRAPQAEVIVVEAPELRIISDALWRAAHGRQHRTYPHPERSERYLLSGFLRCGQCGGNLIVSRATSKRGRAVTGFVCSTHRTRPGTCANAHRVPLEPLTTAIVEQLKGAFLNELQIRDSVARLSERQQGARQECEHERQQVLDRLTKLGIELSRFNAVIAGEPDPPKTILVAIREREQQRDPLLDRVNELDRLLKAPAPKVDVEGLLARVVQAFEDLEATIARDVPAARRTLAQMLLEPIRVSAHVEARVLMVRFEGRARYQDLVPEDVPGTEEVVLRRQWVTQDLKGQFSNPPTTREVLVPPPSVPCLEWCPRGDSNTRHAV
jgi:site-specific DNA recombinase